MELDSSSFHNSHEDFEISKCKTKNETENHFNRITGAALQYLTIIRPYWPTPAIYDTKHWNQFNGGASWLLVKLICRLLLFPACVKGITSRSRIHNWLFFSKVKIKNDLEFRHWNGKVLNSKTISHCVIGIWAINSFRKSHIREPAFSPST